MNASARQIPMSDVPAIRSEVVEIGSHYMLVDYVTRREAIVVEYDEYLAIIATAVRDIKKTKFRDLVVYRVSDSKLIGVARGNDNCIFIEKSKLEKPKL
jgi:predicted RNA-binding protein (virulence factor B family)